MTSQEMVFKINKVIWATKLRVLHVRISIPKQYQIMMPSAARVKFIKTKVTFRYHTKGVSNQVSSNSDHKIKSYACSNSSNKMGKKMKSRKNISGLQNGRGSKGITNCRRDYKSMENNWFVVILRISVILLKYRR